MAEATWHPSALAVRSQRSRTGEPRFTDAEDLSADWRTALDVAHAAVVAADSLLPPTETHERSVRLADERREVERLLVELARDQRADARFWTVAPWDGRPLFGLSPTATASAFTLDGAAPIASR